jgi:hypothetical protein
MALTVPGSQAPDSGMQNIAEEDVSTTGAPSPSEFDVHAAFLRHLRSEQVRTYLQLG